MKLIVTTLCAASALATIHCENLNNYQCYSSNGYCLGRNQVLLNRALFQCNILDHLVKECANGTVCDSAFEKAHPNESPCIDTINSYGCNKKNLKCEKGAGVFTYSSCRAHCVPPTPPTPPPAPGPTPGPCNGKVLLQSKSSTTV